MSNDEYQQQQFWNESYEKTVIRIFTDEIKQEYEKWFNYTHDLLIKKLKEWKH